MSYLLLWGDGVFAVGSRLDHFHFHPLRTRPVPPTCGALRAADFGADSAAFFESSHRGARLLTSEGGLHDDQELIFLRLARRHQLDAPASGFGAAEVGLLHRLSDLTAVVVVLAVDEELEARSSNSIKQRLARQQHMPDELAAAMASLRGRADKEIEAIGADERRFNRMQQPALAKARIGSDDIVKYDDCVICAVVAKHPPHALDPLGAMGDRKSTRLNSSHHSISYAVFC